VDDVTDSFSQSLILSGSSSALGHGQAIRDIPWRPFHSAHVWVTTWVDYTAKYGFGYVLSNGSFGVYFNDATKMVLAPDGVSWQYVPGGNFTPGSMQTGTITEYPEALKKKVLLLTHFQGFLRSQVAIRVQNTSNGSLATTARNTSNLPIAPSIASNGSSSSSSSTSSPDIGTLMPVSAAETAALEHAAELNRASSSYKSGSLPFMKKLTRAKRMILFRLSNQTVQGVFYDGSSIILSEMGTVVTYLDKFGHYSYHTTANVLNARKRVSSSSAPISPGSVSMPQDDLIGELAQRVRYLRDVVSSSLDSQRGKNS
jgi:POLO box duplicated region